MRILVIGGCGFIGFNVFEYLKSKNYRKILIADDLSGESSKKNLKIIKEKHKDINFKKIDISNYKTLANLIKKFKPSAILALHGQVAVTKSIKNTKKDLNSNFLSIFNLLECLRKYVPNSVLINLSSNKIYGPINELKILEKKTKYISKHQINEKYPLDFDSPYACSKGAADQYMKIYSKIFNLKTVSLRLSCVYGENQWGTEDQGWISWFIKCAKFKKTIRIFGDGKQVRDVLHVKDLSKLILKLLKKKKTIKGQSFNVGGGKKNALSLLDLISKIEKKLKIKINYSFYNERVGDQKYFVNDLSKIKKITGWHPEVSIDKGISNYIDWIEKNY